jgi:endonuclease/exonuclease/phosphatase family metal-dependent hydrolase
MWKKIYWFIIGILLFSWSCSNPNTDKDNASQRTIKIMTYNIHHANPPSKPDLIDVDAIANVIKKENPDLVALQEVDVFTSRSGKNLHQAKAIADKLGMFYFFTKALDYQGGFYGNAVLSKYPILDSLLIDLPALSERDAEDRVWAGVRVQIEGNDLWFGSTHLDYKTQENNLHQSTILLNNLKNIPIPVIIGGDFNVTNSSQAIALFDEQFRRTCTEDCPPTIPQINPTKEIDFIMYRPKNSFSTESHQVIDEQYASDHLPVVAELSIGN